MMILICINSKKSINRDGWTYAAVKELALIRRPYLTIERPREAKAANEQRGYSV